MACSQADDHNSDDDDIEQDHDERDADENYDDSIELSDGLKEQRDGHLATKKNGRHCIFYVMKYIILKMRFRSCVKCMALFLPYRSGPVLRSVAFLR